MRTVLWIAAVLAFSATIIYGIQTGARRYSDFAGYYTASRIVASGDSAALLYDDAWFKLRMHSYGIPDSTFIMYLNPPAVSFVMIPVSWMSPATAKVVWNVITIVLALVAIGMLRRMLQIPLSSERLPILVIITCCTIPFLRNLQRGQIYVLVFVLLLLFIHGYITRRPLIASVPLALLILLKYFGGLFVLLLVVEKRWRELGMTAALVLAGLLLGMLVLGSDTYFASWETFRSALIRSDFAFTGLPCIPAFFGGLLTFHPVYNPHPVFDLPGLALALSAISLIVTVVLTFRSTPGSSLERIVPLVVLSVVFTPMGADHHYMLMALPAGMLLLKNDLRGGKRWIMIALLILLFALLGWSPQLSVATLAGWKKLLAFPRLYAGILLWLGLLMGSSPDVLRDHEEHHGGVADER